MGESFLNFTNGAELSIPVFRDLEVRGLPDTGQNELLLGTEQAPPEQSSSFRVGSFANLSPSAAAYLCFADRLPAQTPEDRARIARRGISG